MYFQFQFQTKLFISYVDHIQTVKKKESINMNGRQSGKKKKRILFKIERKKKLLWPESQPMMMMNVTHPLLTNV